MNILVPHSWLTEYVKTDAQPREIGRLLSLHSASVERIEEKNGDAIYDIEITTNRIDMASVVGLAREVAAVLNQNNIAAEFKELIVSEPESITESLPITIKNDPKLCPRVLGVIIDNVEHGASPDWMREKLEKSGIRSLNNIVDVTNYVMLETGHPTHVFDYDRLKTHTLVIRPSKKGEKITTFEGKTHTLPGNDIVVDDGTGEIIDLPGIAGTKNSVVTNNTKRILFFTENNDARRIRRTCMTLGIHTYASNINKNRPDPETAKIALLRGIKLYKEIAKGTVASRIDDLYENPEETKPITVSAERMKTYIGKDIPAPDVIGMLTPLGFAVTDELSNSHFTVTVPSWRQADVTIEEDVIEEVARIYGYHNIESRVTIGKPVSQASNSNYDWIIKIKQALKYWGFTELYTSSLISSGLLERYDFDLEKCIRLKNPLTEEGEYLRPSLVPGVLQTVAENKNRSEKLRLFELSRVYQNESISKGRPIMEPTMLTFALSGEEKTFYKAKGIVESLFAEMGISEYTFQEGIDESNPLSRSIHQSKRASIVVDEKTVGIIGQLENTMAVDINFDELVNHATSRKTYIPIPEHPPVIEDITFIENKDRPHGDIVKKIKKVSTLITNIEDKGLYNDRRTVRVTFQDPNRNLTEKEVTAIKEKIVAAIA